ncbi:MAG: glycyl radical protein, partial [Ruminiclostridium sp.]|nr:glycyl radical protein [Ruminiclostridium sp.]
MNNSSVIAKGFGKPTARVERLRAAIVDAVPVLDYERALLVTKAYQKYEDLTPIMRRAKMLELVLGEMQVTIRPDELIVGAPTLHPRSSDVFPEYSIDWLIDELDTLSTRETDPFYVSEEAKAALKGIQPYWKGKTNSEYALSLISKESMEAQDFGVYDSGSFLFAGCGHSVVNYEKVILIGYRGILEEVEQAMAKLDRSGLAYIQKEQFYKALQITYNAAINFAHRYAAKAEEMAAVEPDVTRKAELMQIAKNLRHAPEYGAANFYEALQALWLTHCIIRIESNGYSYSPGPVDRYLWPILEKDTEISQEFAQELLDCLFVKFNDSCTCRDKYTAQAFAGYGLFEQVALGGQDERGRDQTNPLTYMLLETVAEVAMPQPSV